MPTASQHYRAKFAGRRIYARQIPSTIPIHQSQTKTQRQPEKGKPRFQAAYLVLPTVSQHHPITPRAEYPT
nr:hypothetical protein [uncultured Kingella sp.]